MTIITPVLILVGLLIGWIVLKVVLRLTMRIFACGCMALLAVFGIYFLAQQLL